MVGRAAGPRRGRRPARRRRRRRPVAGSGSTTSPPSGSPTSWNGARHYGDDDLVGWIGEHRPDFVLCGHIHQSPFRNGGSWVDRIGDTWVFNAGRQIGPVPAHVVLDTDAGEAVWNSLAGSERAGLDRPMAEREPLGV